MRFDELANVDLDHLERRVKTPNIERVQMLFLRLA